MSYIDLTSSFYKNLSQYGVLAGTTITTGLPTPVLNNGYYGTPLGTYSPASNTFSGGNINTGGATSAQTGLTILIIDINNLNLPSQPLLPSYTGQSQSITLQGGNIYQSTSNCAFTNMTITFDNQGDSTAQFFIKTNGYLTFTGVSFELNGVNPCDIFWIAGTYIAGIFTDTQTFPMYGIFITGSYSTFSYPSAVTGHIYSQSAVTIIPQTSVNVTTINTSTCTQNSPVVCYVKGTLILTDRGYIPIEKIKVGHNVVTKGKIINSKKFYDSEFKKEPVIWVSKFKLANLNSESRPICIKMSALAKNYPFNDLYVSPNHSLLLGGNMILAKDILNGKTIYQDEECKGVEYYHLECEHHSVIFANGVLSESYLETNNRHVFE
jgi:Hint domain/Ice-binding-like